MEKMFVQQLNFDELVHDFARRKRKETFLEFCKGAFALPYIVDMQYY